MSRYTLTLKEFLDGGGALPSSSFALVEDFEELFYAHYCDCEIGFETPSLFEVKLNAKAKHVMPLYADKIAILQAQITAIKNNPAKVRTETHEYGATHTSTHTSGSNSELPFDGENPQPTNSNEGDGSADTDARTDVITEDYGLSPVEREQVISINRKLKDLEEECLAEFKNLFMGVYL